MTLIPDPSQYRIRALGDSSIMLTFVSDDADWNWLKAHSITNILRDAGHSFIRSVFATYDTSLIEYDPLAARSDAVLALVAQIIASYSPEYEAWAGAARTFTVPVLYSDDWENDFSTIAAEQGMSEEEFIREHTSLPFTIRLVNAGGSVMMANPTRIRGVRRLASPRIRTGMPGRVGMAGSQCTLSVRGGGRSTTGWRSVARTPLMLAVPEGSEDRGLFRVGDKIHFSSITQSEWKSLEGTPLWEMAER